MGLSFVRSNYASLPSSLRERFDVFSLDLRGIESSSQLECWSDSEYTAAVQAAKGVPGAGAFEQALRQAKEFDQACTRSLGDTLAFFGTGYVARDIDLLREALGEQQLSFYGRSFGTFIGTVYASMFPSRVRAMTLDGAYDPEHYANKPYAYDRPQYRALDASMSHFLDWCAQNPASCGFGGRSPKAAFAALKADLDANPVPTPTGPANGFTLSYRLLFSLNFGQLVWPEIGGALRQAQQRDPVSFLLRPPSPGSFDFLNPNVVVECTDRVFPRDMEELKRNVESSAASTPLLGPPWAFAPPMYDHNHAPACVQWLGDRVSRFGGPFRAKDSAPILVVGTTRDPDTPYQDAVALAHQLDNARLLTFDAEGHTALGRSTCATERVAAYLTDLTLPPAGTVCSDEPPPPAATSRSGSRLLDRFQEGHDLIRIQS